MRAQLHLSDHYCLECLEILDFLALFFHAWLIMHPSQLMTKSNLMTLSMLLVFRDLKFEITSSINAFSWTFLGRIMNFKDWMTFSVMGISMERRAWSEENRFSGRMWWLSSSEEPLWKNIRSRIEFASPDVSEYLVGQELVGLDKNRLNESAMINKSSLMVEWWGNEGSYKQSLILKLPVIMRTLPIFTSVSL